MGVASFMARICLAVLLGTLSQLSHTDSETEICIPYIPLPQRTIALTDQNEYRGNLVGCRFQSFQYRRDLFINPLALAQDAK